MAFNRTSGLFSCDHCAALGAEVYEPFPVCRECGDDCCVNCAHPGTESGSDDGKQQKVTCKRCVLTDQPCEKSADGFHDTDEDMVCRACGYGVQLVPAEVGAR
jgi:hypothetical protein